MAVPSFNDVGGACENTIMEMGRIKAIIDVPEFVEELYTMYDAILIFSGEYRGYFMTYEDTKP